MLEIAEPLDALVRGLILTSVAVLWTILLVRVVGLRSFSKMTAFDFVTTIATGSLIAQAGTRSETGEFLQALAAIAGVFLIQWLLASARQRWSLVKKLLKNEPLLLMEHGKFLDEAMKQSRVSRSNLLEKIRSQGIGDLSEVRAVVLETTGDISVMRGPDVNDALLESVRRL